MIPSILDSVPSFMKTHSYARVSDIVSRSIPKYYLDMVSNPRMSSMIEMARRQDSITSSIRKALDSPILNLVKQASALRVPNSIMEALNSINKHHEKFAQLVKSISRPLPFMKDHSHNWNSLLHAYNKSISQMISVSLKEGNWTEIENIEELEATIANLPSITEKFSENYAKANKWFLNKKLWVEKFIKKHPIVFYLLSLIPLIIAARGFYTSEFGYRKDSQPETQPAILNTLATKEDIENAIETLKLDVKKGNSRKIISNSTKVYFKPNSNSKILDTLIKNDDIVLLQTNHKWALINYTKSDNDICTGWILKKYIN